MAYVDIYIHNKELIKKKRELLWVGDTGLKAGILRPVSSKAPVLPPTHSCEVPKLEGTSKGNTRQRSIYYPANWLLTSHRR